LKNNIITIDGPSASGKGSLAKLLALELNFSLLDSGLYYRAYSFAYTLGGSHKEAKKIFEEYSINNDIQNPKIEYKNQNIIPHLRTEKIASLASELSSEKETRSNLLYFQQNIGFLNGLIADGRDMGTIVFPEADTKIFLNADLDARAWRRYYELEKKGIDTSIEDVKKDIARRDKSDTEREISPLIASEDAVKIDSTNLSIEEVLIIALKAFNSESY